ncbi:hypothetical protein BLNAU_20897 [Blattamonas nauphoetae]|nr:hypothetical protein BLNAU_20893 [Blattamonas nauphoetae]KAK2944188.1 hypothetical protein BLNAU_20897 [Blattamonas nauphoetae]
MSTFDDLEELTSLLVGTRRKFQTDNVSDLIFLAKLISTQRIKIIPLIEHDLLARLFSVQSPQTVPLSNALLHLHLLSVITLFLESPFKNKNSKDHTRTTTLRIERVLEVTKSYLAFNLPKENFLGLDHEDRLELSRTITKLTKALTDLGQYEAKLGREVIAEREMWEVARITETEHKRTLELRLKDMNRRDEDMWKKKTDRWVLRRRRLGEYGFEDALEARMGTREYLEETDDIVDVIDAMEKEEGLNFDVMDDDDSDDSFVPFDDSDIDSDF